jgi:putative tricarboxylic transport membrane protein
MDPAILTAFQRVFLDPGLWLIVLASAAYGTFMGSVPGLTATMATALLVPLTYWLDPIPALAAIVTSTACAIFSGDIPSTLLRIPGTPASAAYTEDAYGFTQRGQPDVALGVALVSSVVGGLFGAVVLILLGPQLARAASWFSAAEYFWLYMLGLSCALIIAQGSLAKGVLAVLLGLLLSTVGLGAAHAEARFTFGQPELYQGINFIPAMIGLFGMSEVLKNLLRLGAPGVGVSGALAQSTAQGSWPRWISTTVARPARLMLSRSWASFRSGVIGTAIGILPGAGADIASWVTVAVTRRTQRGPADDEPAALERLCDAGNANNAALAGAWIPALVFGIPGDSITAIVIGVMLMKNIKPGPEIFTAQATLVYSLYMLFILANVLLLPVGLLAIRAGSLVIRVPRRILMPVILLACLLGSYSINGSPFDIGVMLAMGLLGFWLERRGVPLGPVVLGIILGGPLEERFIQTATGAGGSLLGFVDRPLALLLAACWAALWVSMLWLAMRRSRHAAHTASPPSGDAGPGAPEETALRS